MPSLPAMPLKQTKRNNLALLRSRRLCIICAKSTESDCVAKHLGLKRKIPGDLVEGIHKGHDFYLGSIVVDRVEIPYYVTACSRQGIQTFGIEASAMFSILRPEFALHLGSCAGFGGEGKVQLGDVIFGARAINYEEGVFTTEPGKFIARRNENEDEAGPAPLAPANIGEEISKLTFLPDSKIWDTGNERMDGYVNERRKSQYKYGDFISGCALRLDAQQLLKRVKDNVLRDTKALEMEASAFLQLCSHMDVTCLGIIKGVSDLGDASRGTDKKYNWRVAMEDTANAAIEYIAYTFKDTPLTNRPLEQQPGAEIAYDYCENVVREVVSKALTQKIDVAAGAIAIKGFHVVLPMDDDPDNLVMDALRLNQRNYGLDETYLYGINRTLSMSYRDGYLVDFPEDLKDLVNCWDLKHQIEAFKEALVRQLKGFNRGKGFKVNVMTWAEFETWCNEADAPAPGVHAVANGGANGGLNGHVGA